jgi:hypothetical protein
MKHLAWVLLLLTLCACGGNTMTAVETGVPTPPPTGAVTGNYTFTITGGSSCVLPGLPAHIAMVAAPAGDSSKPEVRVLLPGGDSTLELAFLLSDQDVLHGSMGTKTGVPIGGGLYLYFRTVGTGTVTRSGDGRGEVVDATMFGEIDIGLAPDDIGGQAACTAEDHHWSLRAQP